MGDAGGVSVLLVEDYRLLREGIARTLADAGFEVVGEVGDGAEALTMAEDLRPDVVLVDTSMIDGQLTVDGLRDQAPESRILLLASEPDPTRVEEARSLGAAGYLLKDASSREVSAAVARAAMGREDFVRAGFGAARPAVGEEHEAADDDAPAAPDLTPRETEILQLLADGRSPGEVAEQLTISPKTIRNHLSNAYESLGVSSRSQAVVTALRHGLIELPD